MFENCIPMLQMVAAYGVVYVLNCLFGIYTNCIVNGEKFVFKKTLCSLLKIVLAAVSGVGVAVGFNLFAVAAENFGLSVDEMTQDTLSVVTFVILFFKAFIATSEDVFEKIKTLTEVSVTVEEAKETELKYQKPKIEASGTSASGTTVEEYKAAHPEYSEEDSIQAVG